MAKLVLELHDIYNKGDQIEKALRDVIDEAVAKKIDLVEIIPGKGSGQLKKKVLRSSTRRRSRPCTTGWTRTRRTSVALHSLPAQGQAQEAVRLETAAPRSSPGAAPPFCVR